MRRTGVESITDTDYQMVKDAVDHLDASRGDVLAIEPTGFVALNESPTVSSIIPVTLPPEIGGQLPVPHELRSELAELMENARATFRVNNLAYAAIHALLKDIPVCTAEITMEDWNTLQAQLQASPEDDATKKEHELYYRNGRMLSRLGDTAIHMAARQPLSAQTPPILLYISGSAHTPRLSHRLHASHVQHTTITY